MTKTVILCFLFVINSFSSILRVPQDYSSIQNAISSLGISDTILLLDGNYDTCTFNNTSTATTLTLTLASDFLADNDTAHINATTFSHIDVLGKWNIKLIGITIKNGVAKYNTGGGGLLFNAGRDTIYASLADCRILNNFSAYQGGGISCVNTHLILSNCIISGNVSMQNGGGLYFFSFDFNISNCIISENTTIDTVCDAFGSGGGIYNGKGTIKNTLFYKNRICVKNLQRTYKSARNASIVGTTIENCTFYSDDTSYGDYGLIGSALNVRNSIIYDTYCYCGHTSYSFLEIPWDTLVIYHNYNFISGDTIYDTLPYGCNDSAVWLGCITHQPEPFINSQTNDFRLISTSQAVDGGNPSSDYSLEPFYNSICNTAIDMGAYGNTPNATPECGLKTESLMDSHNNISIYPNPFNPSVTLIFANPKKRAQINIYSIDGRKIMVMRDIQENKIEWKPKNMVSGIYTVEVHADGKTIRKNICFAK